MYAIGQFAKLAGVTAKALYLYERHGLLKPRRSRAGYRRYTLRDLQQLERVLSLKSLGLSLQEIARLHGDQLALRGWEAKRREAGAGITRAPDRASPSRLALFREIANVLARDPSGASAQPMVARWNALLDAEAGGDAEFAAERRHAWTHRDRWPDGLRRYVASLYDAAPAEWDRVAACIDTQS